MKQVIYLNVFISLLFLGSKSFAQKVEFGILGGIGGYVGDINTYPTFNPEKIDHAYGIWLKKNFNPYWGIRMGYHQTNISAADSIFTSDPFKLNRNLSFRNRINEISFQTEFNFMRFMPEETGYRFSPYINAGISWLFHNPQAFIDSLWYDLRPIGTEGQGQFQSTRLYSKSALAISVGGGIKYNFAGRSILALEFGLRNAFTDYLDDISGVYFDNELITRSRGAAAGRLADRTQDIPNALPNNPGKVRGDSNMRDWYHYIGIAYIYSFRASKCDAFK